MDGVFAVAQEVESSVVERPVFLVIQRFQAEGNVRVPKERRRLFHDAAQRIEVEGVELAGAGNGGHLEFGKRRDVMEKRSVFGGAESKRVVLIGAV